MTRILVQRGSAGSSSSNQSRTPVLSSSNAPIQPQNAPAQANLVVPDEVHEQVILNELPEVCADSGNKTEKSDDLLVEGFDQSNNVGDENVDKLEFGNNENQVDLMRGFSGLMVTVHSSRETDGLGGDNLQCGTGSSQPPPSCSASKAFRSNSILRRLVSGTSDSPRIGVFRRLTVWPTPARTSPSASRPSDSP